MRAPPSVRPSFELRLAGTPDSIAESIRSRLPRVAGRVVAQSAYHTLELLIVPEHRHYWSPWLSVTIAADDESDPRLRARLRGRYGPHPAVWTMLMSMHIALVFVAIGGLVFGAAQWTLQQTPWALLTIPAVAIAMAVVYVVSLLGQRLGAHQMDTLRDALDELLDDVG